jgi:clan AA aspartic protease (TIGR02281 family)
MIKNILLFVLTVLVVWLSRDYFSITLPAQVKYEQVNKNLLVKEYTIIKPSGHKKQTIIDDDIPKESPLTLDALLAQNKFYDALSFYLSHSSTQNKKKMEVYLRMLATQKPILALEYMHVYLDEVPESSIKNVLITTYIHEHNYAKAIELIIAAKENYVSQSEDKRLNAQLKETALKHIDSLIVQKEYAQVINFLEEMIAYDNSNSFYSFRLAQLYLELDKTAQAAVLLDELQYDEVYAQKVKSYIQEIDVEEESNYEYVIPLTKHGDHYLVNTVLDGILFRLMLDTGATYIYIDSDKASALEVINSNVRLQTAGGDVQAMLRKASTMRVGNLELNDMKVTTAPFKREGIDGLLGMNFLKQFEFFINQEEGVLYLNSK